MASEKEWKLRPNYNTGPKEHEKNATLAKLFKSRDYLTKCKTIITDHLELIE